MKHSVSRALLSRLADRRQSCRRERALTHEVSTLRRVVAVALRDKASTQQILAAVQQDPRNGVSLVRHIEVCQQLHLAEARIRDLEARAHARV